MLRTSAATAVLVIAVSGAMSAGSLPSVARAGTVDGAVAAASGNADPVATAVATAARTGVAQPVTALTSPTQLVTALPSGRLVATESILPTRVSTGSGWVPVDTTLTRTAAGRYAPRETAYGTVSFSPGGSGPLATLTSQGATLSFTWPTTLPTPTLAGDTLTYASVLPGVDLQVSPTAAGGFSDVLVVQNAAAAANPMLADLTLQTISSGLTLVPAAGGGTSAVTGTGQDIFDSPAAQMWDSTSRPALGAAPNALARSAISALHPDAPTAFSAGFFSHQAPVGVHPTGGRLALAPDAALLTAPSTVYPVFIDPTFNPHSASGAKAKFDEVKQGCPSDKYYDNSGSDADNGELGVGYNGFSGGCDGNDATYYQFGFPSNVDGATVISATLNAEEVYSATCATTKYTVDNTATGTINANTDWTNRPGSASSSYVNSTTVGPACTSDPTAAFDVLAAAQHVASAADSTLTLELYEATNTTDVALKRFTDNPSLTMTYDHTPNTPAAADMSMTSGSTSDPCENTAPFPYMGKTASTSPPVLHAKVSDPDVDTLAANFTYWNISVPSKKVTVTSANVASGGTATITLPASFISGLGSSATVAYAVSVTDGYLTSSGSINCQVTIEATSPDAPTVSSTSFPPVDSGSGLAADQAGTFSFADPNATGCFIYRLQSAPAVPTGDCPTSSSTTSTSGTGVANSSNDYSATITPTLYGLNTLYVYAEDKAGNVGGPTAYVFQTAHTAQGGAATSLAAAFNDQGITSSALPSGDPGMGGGDTFSAADLEAAGWTPGKTVNIDGANLTLPNFGSGADDNVAAANQIIDLSGQGDALVVLATGVYGTSSPGAPALPVADTAAPYVPAGTKLVQSCTDPTSGTTVCAASGMITYGDGTTSDYNLEVPDWCAPPVGDASFLGTTRLSAAGTDTSHTPSIYALTIPLDPQEQLSSITLPDLSGVPDSIGTPTLHIFAMGVRDTSTAGSPISGDTWAGSWAEPTETVPEYSSTNAERTFRIAVRPTLSGGTVRIKLDNSMGSGPIDLSHATIAPAGTNFTSGTPTATPTTLTFGGSQSAVIPEGTDLYSDALTQTVTAGSWMDVSFTISNAATAIPVHNFANDAYAMQTAAGSGDHSADTTGASFTALSSSGESVLLTDLDVLSSTATPTVAVLGDQLTDSFTSGNTAITTATGASLADDLQGQATAGADGFISEGIEGNTLASDSSGLDELGGPALLQRLDRDVLDQPAIGTVVVAEGLQDLLNGTSVTTLDNDDYPALTQLLTSFGVNIVFDTLTPCYGFSACTTTVDDNRQTVNNALDGFANYQPPQFGTIAINYADTGDNLAASTSPQTLQTAAPDDYDSGDHLNLSLAGYVEEATVVTQTGGFYGNANLQPA